MTGTARPDHTYAVVVGIERYDAGPEWDLDGPASDAARFTGWLVDHDVPPHHISVFWAPLDDGPKAPALPAGVRVGPARRDPINELLTRQLPAIRGDLLWLFWAGHGVLTRDESRRLFYADAGLTDKRNLDLSSLLTALRSDLYAGLPRQIAVVDACQNHVERLALATTLPGETFAYGQPAPARDQFVLYAASPGQVAANRASVRAGAFSEALMAELAGVPPGVWPPDMTGLAARLTERFAAALRDGRADQKPATFRYRTWSGEEQLFDAAVAPAPAGPRRPSPAAVGELVGRLLDIDAAADPVGRAAIIRQLRKGLASSIRYSPLDRVHLVNLVTRSAEWPGGLAELMGVIRLYADPHDPALAAADAAERGLAREPSGELP